MQHLIDDSITRSQSREWAIRSGTTPTVGIMGRGRPRNIERESLVFRSKAILEDI